VIRGKRDWQLRWNHKVARDALRRPALEGTAGGEDRRCE
jgi:hypothetical protein